MATQRVSRAFKDISLSFEAHPVTKDLPILLVQTQFTERFFDSDIGSSVADLLFEFVDFGSSSQIQEEIKLTIEQYEPRVDNIIVNVRPAPDRNEFECVIAYDIVGLNTPTQEFSFVLEATR
jgi:phage baseplate assembly protein W